MEPKQKKRTFFATIAYVIYWLLLWTVGAAVLGTASLWVASILSGSGVELFEASSTLFVIILTVGLPAYLTLLPIRIYRSSKKLPALSIKKRLLLGVVLFAIPLLGGLNLLKFPGIGGQPLPQIHLADGTACALVAAQKSLDNVVQCESRRYESDRGTVTLVQASYGKAQDCLSGCFYADYTAVVDNWIAYDFFLPPDHLLNRVYGLSCVNEALNREEIRSDAKREALILKSDRKGQQAYEWEFRFFDYNEEWRGDSAQQECNVDGTLAVFKSAFPFERSDNNVTSFDDSELDVLLSNGKPGSKIEAVRSRNSSLCDRSDNLCFIMIGQLTGNPEVCERIERATTRGACIRTVQLSMGIYEEYDPEVALPLRDEAIATGNTALCEEIENHEYLVDSCFRAIALKNQDVSVCDKIRDGTNRGFCKTDIFKAFDDPLKCLELGVDRFRCLSRYAEWRADEDICQLHETQSNIDNCIYSYVKWWNPEPDPIVCEKIHNGRTRTLCYEVYDD